VDPVLIFDEYLYAIPWLDEMGGRVTIERWTMNGLEVSMKVNPEIQQNFQPRPMMRSGCCCCAIPMLSGLGFLAITSFLGWRIAKKTDSQLASPLRKKPH
jgi:hypothetical protein